MGFMRSKIAQFGAFATILAASTFGLATLSTTYASSDASSEPGLQDVIYKGWIASDYGVARKNLRVHTGIDVASEYGSPLFAPADSTVIEATDLFRNEPRWGKTVVLETKGGLRTWFAHVESYSVKPGDQIKQGTEFAKVGNSGQSSGPHVHIETYLSNVRVDPKSVWAFLK